MDIIRILSKAVDDYFETGTSDLTDDQFDALYDEAKRMGLDPPKKPDAKSDGPWMVVPHATWMGSITESFSEGDAFKAWIGADYDNRMTGFASLKYDGMALELQYKVGKLVHAVLRGDYTQGEDVAVNAKHAFGVPHEIPFEGDLSVFGELVISFNNLNALNAMLANDRKEPYKTPRNAVAMVRSSTRNVRALSLFTFRPYATFPRLRPDQNENLFDLEMMTIDRHPARKFNPVKASRTGAPQAWQARHATHYKRDEWKYLLDGIVYLTDGGETAKLKFPAQSAVTTVIDVVEQLGRTGVISPVCRFDPINLGGAKVKQATAHNHELIATKLAGLGPGAKVLVSRRGDVIPHLEEVLQPSDTPWVPSMACPSCGKPAVEDGSVMRCSSDPSECPGTSMGLIIKFCRELGIDGFGPGVVSALFMADIVALPCDLFIMDPELVATAKQPGGSVLGETTAARLIENMEKRSNEGLTLGELLGAIGVAGCAKEVMTNVADHFHGDPQAIEGATLDDLLQVPGVGPERASSILFFIASRWKDVVEPLFQVLDVTKSDGPMSGKVVCITLGLRHGSRPQVESMIRRAGGKVKSSVTKDLTHLVCNTPDESTTKLKRAKELGVPIISEDQLFTMMGVEAKKDSPINPDDDF